MRAADGRSGRLSPHGRVALGGAARGQRPAGEDAARAARRRHEEFRPPQAPRRAASTRRGPAPLVVFVGKLIVSKGVDLLLAAWPLVSAAHPDARLQIAGYGEYEEGLRAAAGGARTEATSMTPGRLRGCGWGLEGGRRSRCRSSPRSSPIRRPATSRPPAARPARSSSSAGWSTTRWPSCCREAEALVMPSTFPEAFGMVAARLRPAGRCRSPPATRGCGRSRGSWPPALPAGGRAR